MTKINNPLTEEQIKFINEKKGDIPVREIAEILGVPKYKIWNYFTKVGNEKRRHFEERFFNVHAHENWII